MTDINPFLVPDTRGHGAGFGGRNVHVGTRGHGTGFGGRHVRVGERSGFGRHPTRVSSVFVSTPRTTYVPSRSYSVVRGGGSGGALAAILSISFVALFIFAIFPVLLI